MASIAPQTIRSDRTSVRPSSLPKQGMALEAVKEGQVLEGIVPGRAVEICQVKAVGRDQVRVIYEFDGQTGTVQLNRDDEPRLRVAKNELPWSFTADPELFRLAAEAERIELAWFFDSYLAIESSRVEPLPHQVSAVYEDMLQKMPLRFLLADDPGAGKTIMAGLLIKELILRAELNRCLIVAPGSLVEQWQNELSEKFDLEFQILSRELVELSRTGNPFEGERHRALWIARIDQLSRSEELQATLARSGEWDLVVVDEAHKMSAPYAGKERRPTKRYKLGELLAERARHFLLMTATPHNGKEEDFQSFLALLDKDRFEGRYREKSHKIDPSDLMRRNIKEDLCRFDGTPLFPDRISKTVHYELSPRERELYEEVTKYVRDEMNRAERLGDGAKGRRTTIGFALQTLQRRLASSPAAIFSSLARRQSKLEERAGEIERGVRALGALQDASDFANAADLDDDDDLTAEELEQLEALSEGVTAAQSLPELRVEIAILKGLVQLARDLKHSGEDVKWRELKGLLELPEMRRPDGGHRKLVIFSEANDTLFYLQNKMQSLLGRPEAVAVIHGGVSRQQRQDIVARFNHNPDLVVLIANDAAGEGVNLHKGANLMINYDLPWNPNRLEQRFGRVHRIGQKETCYLWNLTAQDTREGAVYTRLLDKLENERKALGGKVYDVLGEVFEGRPLRQLLMDAVMEDKPERRDHLVQDLEKSLDRDRLRELLEKQALVTTRLTETAVNKLGEHMERARLRKLQPHFIEGFFVEAFKRHGGRLLDREPGVYELRNVPQILLDKARTIGPAISDRYDRVLFDKKLEETLPKGASAEWIMPGHVLLDSVVAAARDAWSSALTMGTVLIDDDENSPRVRLVVQLQLAIEDGHRDVANKENVVSRQLVFVEMAPDGTLGRAGHAPFLDLRSPSPQEHSIIEGWRAQGVIQQLFADLEKGPWRERVMTWAIDHLVPEAFADFRKRRLEELDKTEYEVTARLKSEIRHWDRRAAKEADRVRQGKGIPLNVENLRKRAEGLEQRLEARRRQIELQRQLRSRPIRIQAAALVVPRVLLQPQNGQQVLSKSNSTEDLSTERARVERVAMEAVLQAELSQGCTVTDISARRGEGYDIESVDAQGRMKFLEVKGYATGTQEISLSKNEILKSKNCPIRFRVVLVEVAGERAVSMHELMGYDFGELGFQQTRGTFSLKGMLEKAKRLA